MKQTCCLSRAPYLFDTVQLFFSKRMSGRSASPVIVDSLSGGLELYSQNQSQLIEVDFILKYVAGQTGQFTKILSEYIHSLLFSLPKSSN